MGRVKGKIYIKKVDGHIGHMIFGKRRIIGYCDSKCKWDLDTGQWKAVEGDEDKKAFSIITFDSNFGKKKADSLDEYDYFIFMEGMRLENYPVKGGNTAWGSKHLLSQLETLDINCKVANILVDNDAPLEKEAELIAQYVERLKQDEKCKRIHLFGVSKCGTMLVAMLKYLSDSNLDKLNLMAYSAPYLGTIFASPETLYKRIDEVVGNVESKLLESVVKQLIKIEPVSNEKKSLKSQSLVDVIKSIHWRIFSKSHMDYDIAEIDGNGVPEIHKDRYDASYLNNMFDERTIQMLRKVLFTNITTICSEQTLRNAIFKHNVTAGMLYLADKILIPEPSDGMVTLESSTYIEKVCAEKDIKIKSVRLSDGHHDILKDSDLLIQIINSKMLYSEMYKQPDEK